MPTHRFVYQNDVADDLPAAVSEQWAAIPSAPGYEASTLGRIRSVDRVVVRSDGTVRRRRGVLLRPQTNGGDYLAVRVTGRRWRYVHALVLEAFRGPRPDGMECLHGPGGARDNRLVNLRWGTKAENAQDVIRHGRHWELRKTHCPRRHPLADPNLSASQKARGKRTCLACQRARSHAQDMQRRGAHVDLQAISDEYYRKLMKAGT